MTQQTMPLPTAQGAAIQKDGIEATIAIQRRRVLWLSFTGFALMFAAWTMFGVLGIPIRKEFGLTDMQLAWLSAIAILNGAIWRLPLGVVADRIGGRAAFLGNLVFCAIASFLVSRVDSYPALMACAALVGMAGNSFTIGSAWNAAWFPKEQQGFALGLFGAGNVGASVTKFIGPVLIAIVPVAGLAGGFVPGGWRFVPFLYSILLLVMAGLILMLAPTPDRTPGQGRAFGAMFAPLKEIRVWRFSLYYTVVFGAYVALSVWLPKYYVDVYGLPLATAALVTTPFIFASSLLRPVGGWLSDKFGPRKVTYAVFIGGAIFSALLTLSQNLYTFTALILCLGITQGFGKASTIKYIPDYYPKDVGAVVGLVGAIAAIGGFALPPLFAYLKTVTGQPQALFYALFALSTISLLWLHIVVLGIHRNEHHAI
jgi:MFS transporter, NNP family, nitrate/nitrite transporter